jgi:hypothetical protein
VRREARREEQVVLVARREIERLAEPQDHVDAGARSPRFQKRDVAGGHGCREREVELGHPALDSPVSKEPTER